ncbi:Cyclic phosphodiesterase-like protein [Elsinoe fawcettii]|nr:Cyclic phosphodiesterase-like protein [Elsinoe fawcettii]
MPGSSLWLIPPKDAFNRAMQTQITSMVPMRFAEKPPNFIPHITLTSHIKASLHEPDAQAWLDSLELNLEDLQAANEVREKKKADENAMEEKRALEAGDLKSAAPSSAPPADPEKAALSEDASAAEPPSSDLEKSTLTGQSPVPEQAAPADPEKAALSEPTPTQPLAPAATDPENAALSQPPSKPTPPPEPTPATSEPKTPSKPSIPIEINLHELEAGEAFFRKLALNASFPSPGLSALATVLRAQGVYNNDIDIAKSWEKHEYRPHLSLLYSDVPFDTAQKKIPGVLQDLVRAKAILKPGRDGIVSRGGSIVLVQTDKEIGQWKPVASRPLPDTVWKWTMLM